MNRTIIFDFDGTIADTLHVMVDLYNRLAPRYGCLPVSQSDVAQLRGEHPRSLMKRFHVRWFVLPFLARAMQRAFSGEVGSAVAFDGVVEALRALHGKGVTLGILSSNMAPNIRAFLAAHDIENLFAFVEGHPNVFSKHRDLLRIMRQRGLAKSDVTYVGDEIRDVEAAKRAGVRIASVTWGFQPREALANAHPDILVDRPESLIDLAGD